MPEGKALVAAVVLIIPLPEVVNEPDMVLDDIFRVPVMVSADDMPNDPVAVFVPVAIISVL
jgi:hypothetical protein